MVPGDTQHVNALVSAVKRQSARGERQKHGGIRNGCMMLAKKQEPIGKDLGKCEFKISQENNDRAAKAQEHVVACRGQFSSVS